MDAALGGTCHSVSKSPCNRHLCSLVSSHLPGGLPLDSGVTSYGLMSQSRAAHTFMPLTENESAPA